MLKLRDIMTTDVVTVSPEMSVRDAMDLLADRHISGAPVLTGKTLVGVVSSTDLMAFAASIPGAPRARSEAENWEAVEATDEYTSAGEGDESAAAYFTDMWVDAGAETGVRFAEIDSPEWSVLDEHTVSDAMTFLPVWTLAPDTTVQAAAEFMRQHGIHRVLITEGTQLLGIVTTTDIANAVAQHRLFTRTYVFKPGSEFDERGYQDGVP
jgi:CBS domain-containing protein